MTPYIYTGLMPKDRRSFYRKMIEPKENHIIQIVEKNTGISKKLMSGRSHLQDIVAARHLAMLLIRKQAGLSFKHIAKIFKRDHSTVISAIKSAENRVEFDADFRNIYNKVIKDLGV